MEVVLQTLHAAQATHKVDGQIQLLQALASWRQEEDTSSVGDTGGPGGTFSSSTSQAASCLDELHTH